MDLSLKIIGKIHSVLTSKEDCPLQENESAPPALVEIFPQFLEGIREINPGSEILLLTWLHEADRSVIKCVPRMDYGQHEIGVFSTRSPDRPNPIGMHRVKVLSLDNSYIKVSALEVIDQTPILDIKPVIN